MRCPIVASGTRNAAAISRVVSPPTAAVSVGSPRRAERRVTAQEHEDEGVVAAATPDPRGASDHDAARSSRRRRASSRRYSSTMRRETPPGPATQRVVGQTVGRPRVAAATSASCTASSASAKSRYRRATTPRTCGASSRSRPSSSWVAVVTHTSGSGAPMISRTSMGWRIGTPFGPGAADAWAAISIARSSVSTSIDAVAGEQLLATRGRGRRSPPGR